MKELRKLLEEDKFLFGAIAPTDPYAKIAYSANINMLVSILLKHDYDKEYMEFLVKYHFEIAVTYLEEIFKADTAESELRYAYFERICTICHLRPLDSIIQ